MPRPPRASFARVTGDDREAGRFAAFYDRLAPLARALFPTLTEPLIARVGGAGARGRRRALGRRSSSARSAARSAEPWSSDIARGIVMTDGLIGTFASADEASLRQNRCFLYHVIGGGTGDWDVPVGGMGRVSAELERAARAAGAELRTDAPVTQISPDGEVRTAGARRRGGPRTAGAERRRPLRARRASARGRRGRPADAERPAGAQFKVNMLLRRLPRLHDAEVAPEAAFAGTFHINETMTQLDAAHARGRGRRHPATRFPRRCTATR